MDNLHVIFIAKLDIHYTPTPTLLIQDVKRQEEEDIVSATRNS